MSISGHKIYGPKGIGALYVRRRPRVRLEALQSGGGQERNLRSGTLPTPLCVGLGAAAKLCKEQMMVSFFFFFFFVMEWSGKERERKIEINIINQYILL